MGQIVKIETGENRHICNRHREEMEINIRSKRSGNIEDFK